jgi:hypothetical protein
MFNVAPTQVTTDGHDSYSRAIREVLGPNVQHRCSAYLNRRIERDPMLGFGTVASAQHFCRAFEEVRQYFRARRKQNQVISLAATRPSFCSECSNSGKDPARHQVKDEGPPLLIVGHAHAPLAFFGRRDFQDERWGSVTVRVPDVPGPEVCVRQGDDP